MLRSAQVINRKTVHAAQGQSVISGRLLARNTLLNLTGQIVPLLVAFLVIPLLVRGMGADRFGVLTLSWMVLGYFSLFDLGLGRATTRFVAESIGKGETGQLPGMIWTSFCLHLMLGVIAGGVLSALTPYLAGKVFRISPDMTAEAMTMFFILSASIPVILASTVSRGVLEASQRFDLVNLVQIPSGTLTFLLPLAGLSLGFGLPGIVALLMLARLCAALAYFILCLTIFPGLRAGFSFDTKLIRPLLSFGGWITVSNVAGPVLLYLDRFMIGAVVSMAAVAFYTAPFEMVIRLMVFPVSIIMVLFPVFSSSGSVPGKQIAMLYARALKYLLLVMGPLVLIMILFAEVIMRLWLGAAFAEKSTLAFQILAAGMILTPWQISISLLQGIGRPDIIARFYLVKLALYMPLLWFMVRDYGITGAALAWACQLLFETAFLAVVFARGYGIGLKIFSENGLLRAIALLAVLAVLFLSVHLAVRSLIPQAVASGGFLIIFGLVTWHYVLDERDRALLHLGPSVQGVK